MIWKMKIKRIFLSRKNQKHPRALGLIKSFQPEEILEISDLLEANHYLEQFADPFSEGKQSLFLTNFPGRFFEPCPCAKGYVNCGYWILSPVVGCPLDCSYCILQGYLNSYPIQVYLNLEDLFQEVERWEKRKVKARLRLGTGELADSLALEPELGYAKSLIEFFSSHTRCVFELKTKTDRVEPILNFKPSENIVISWSVNPKSAVENEEKGSASLEERLKAAGMLAEKGWRVGFHFDPILPEYGINDYLALVEQIFSAVPAGKIAWISLGMLRFPPKLKPIIKDRHPDSRILCGEMFPGKDNKLRYLRPIREKFYRALSRRIRDHSPKTPVYLCMESETLWEKILTGRVGRGSRPSPSTNRTGGFPASGFPEDSRLELASAPSRLGSSA